jgi:hypothetical protein
LERLYFLLSVFFCFICCNKWLDHIMFVLVRDTLRFHCQEHLVFTIIVQRVFSFSSTAFSFLFFALIFVQNLLFLCIKVYLYLWSMLALIFNS